MYNTKSHHYGIKRLFAAEQISYLSHLFNRSNNDEMNMNNCATICRSLDAFTIGIMAGSKTKRDWFNERNRILCRRFILYGAWTDINKQLDYVEQIVLKSSTIGIYIWY
ncbi:uncharacterized protein LOC142221386 [Haematobia irritans]|uniref:uncharacterized protein LOC142221386 n=1 Tax=Haematobia irritans TaxID=7368 RepID=UPI003F4FD343